MARRHAHVEDLRQLALDRVEDLRDSAVRSVRQPPGAAGSAAAVPTEPPIMPRSKSSMTLLDMKDLFDEDSLM